MQVFLREQSDSHGRVVFSKQRAAIIPLNSGSGSRLSDAGFLAFAS
jgi:hypothetical protein